jgi:hypothetical protein
LTGTEFLTNIDTESKLCVYHPINVLLPTRSEGYWVVHDELELESLQKQAIIDLGKFVAHDLAIDGVGAIAVKATEGVAAISLYLGISSIIDAIQGGGDPPVPIDVNAINTMIGCTTLPAVSGILRTQAGRRGSGPGRWAGRDSAVPHHPRRATCSTAWQAPGDVTSATAPGPPCGRARCHPPGPARAGRAG